MTWKVLKLDDHISLLKVKEKTTKAVHIQMNFNFILAIDYGGCLFPIIMVVFQTVHPIPPPMVQDIGPRGIRKILDELLFPILESG